MSKSAIRLDRIDYSGAGHLRKMRVTIDSEHCGYLPRCGGTGHFSVTPGTHKIRVSIDCCKSKEVELVVADGETINMVCGAPRETIDRPNSDKFYLEIGAPQAITGWEEGDRLKRLYAPFFLHTPLEEEVRMKAENYVKKMHTEFPWHMPSLSGNTLTHGESSFALDDIMAIRIFKDRRSQTFRGHKPAAGSYEKLNIDFSLLRVQVVTENEERVCTMTALMRRNEWVECNKGSTRQDRIDRLPSNARTLANFYFYSLVPAVADRCVNNILKGEYRILNNIGFSKDGVEFYTGSLWWKKRRSFRYHELHTNYGWSYFFSGGPLGWSRLVRSLDNKWLIVSSDEEWNGTLAEAVFNRLKSKLAKGSLTPEPQ